MSVDVGELDRTIASLRAEVERLTAERDAWMKAALTVERCQAKERPCPYCRDFVEAARALTGEQK